MIAFDLDGTILNYNGHTIAIRYNYALINLLRQTTVINTVAILTNQGGMAFSRQNPARYPTPERVAMRIYSASQFLQNNGWSVAVVMASCYHPRAQAVDVQWAAATLRTYLAAFGVPRWRVYTTERARKPNPLMLRAAGATMYFGDSDEDEAAAKAAGVRFVRVKRFE